MSGSSVADDAGPPTRYLTDVLQNDAELQAFIDLLKQHDVRSYLEIGSKFGGSLWRIATALPEGSRIVSVDLATEETERHLAECIARLCRAGYDAWLYVGDSASPGIVGAVDNLGPFDACLIDGDHTEAGVRADWENYGPMCKMIAFHDIGHYRKVEWGMPIEVPQFWDSIKHGYRHEEIRYDPKQKDNGIGVLWR